MPAVVPSPPPGGAPRSKALKKKRPAPHVLVQPGTEPRPAWETPRREVATVAPSVDKSMPAARVYSHSTAPRQAAARPHRPLANLNATAPPTSLSGDDGLNLPPLASADTRNATTAPNGVAAGLETDVTTDGLNHPLPEVSKKNTKAKKKPRVKVARVGSVDGAPPALHALEQLEDELRTVVSTRDEHDRQVSQSAGRIEQAQMNRVAIQQQLIALRSQLGVQGPPLSSGLTMVPSYDSKLTLQVDHSLGPQSVDESTVGFGPGSARVSPPKLAAPAPEAATAPAITDDDNDDYADEEFEEYIGGKRLFKSAGTVVEVAVQNSSSSPAEPPLEMSAARAEPHADPSQLKMELEQALARHDEADKLFASERAELMERFAAQEAKLALLSGQLGAMTAWSDERFVYSSKERDLAFNEADKVRGIVEVLQSQLELADGRVKILEQEISESAVELLHQGASSTATGDGEMAEAPAPPPGTPNASPSREEAPAAALLASVSAPAKRRVISRDALAEFEAQLASAHARVRYSDEARQVSRGR